MAEANRPGDSEIFDGVTERVARTGVSLFGFKFVIGALLAVLFFLFVGPVLVFTGKLIEARRRVFT